MHRYNIQIEGKVFDKLRRTAFKERVSISEVIRRYINEGIKNDKQAAKRN
jgi:predicted CopG family antitoxin